MQYKRILVLGCCGSGKSTFARRLGEITKLPVVHLDKLYWKPGWTPSTREEYHSALNTALSQDAWIIDGEFSSTLQLRLERCELALYLDYPRAVCLWGVMTRVLKSIGKTRPDMGEGCPERFDWAFIKFTWHFKKTQGTKNKELVRLSGKPVVWFRTRRDAKKYLEMCRYDRT